MWKDPTTHLPICFLISKLQMQGKGHHWEIMPQFYRFLQHSCEHKLSNKISAKKIFSRVVSFLFFHGGRFLKEEGLVRINISDY